MTVSYNPFAHLETGLMALLLGDKEVDQVMDMKDCVQVMEDAFGQVGRGIPGTALAHEFVSLVASTI